MPKKQSAKAAAASKRNLANWEKLQEARAMAKDNWYIAVFFLVMGFSLGLLV